MIRKRLSLVALLAGMLAVMAARPVAADLFLSTLDDSTVHRYAEASGGKPVAPSSPITPGVSFPTGITADPAGNLYLGSFLGPQVYKFNPNSNAPAAPFATIPGANAASGAVHWHAGQLYAGNLSSNTIEHFDAAGNDLGAAAQLPNGDTTAAYGWNSSGQLFAAGYNTGNIYQIASNGTASLYITNSALAPAEQLQQPGGLLFDSNGQLYVSNTGGNKIELFDSQGNFKGDFANASTLGTGPNGESNSPEDLIFSRDGQSILLALSGYSQQGPFGALMQFSLAGTPNTIESNLLVPTGLVYGVVPEPGSAALAGFGALLLGVWWRAGRARRQTPGEVG